MWPTRPRSRAPGRSAGSSGPASMASGAQLARYAMRERTNPSAFACTPVGEGAQPGSSSTPSTPRVSISQRRHGIARYHEFRLRRMENAARAVCPGPLRRRGFPVSAPGECRVDVTLRLRDRLLHAPVPWTADPDRPSDFRHRQSTSRCCARLPTRPAVASIRSRQKCSPAAGNGRPANHVPGGRVLLTAAALLFVLDVVLKRIDLSRDNAEKRPRKKRPRNRFPVWTLTREERPGRHRHRQNSTQEPHGHHAVRATG